MLRVLIRSTSYSSLYFSNQPIATFTIIYNCLVEIELHREIYHFTHERQTLKLDLNQHSAISRSFYHLNYLSDEVWCEPVHCSLFFQYHHDACTTAEPNHIYRTHFSFYAGTLIEVLPQCAIRKLYRSSRSTSHRSNIEFFPLARLERDCSHLKGICGLFHRSEDEP